MSPLLYQLSYTAMASFITYLRRLRQLKGPHLFPLCPEMCPRTSALQL